MTDAAADFQTQIDFLFTAELQFRLASAVRIAVTKEEQPLDLPMHWIHGQQSARYVELALRQDQAEYAALFLHRSATYLMAVAITEAIRGAVHDPKNSESDDIRSAYQIARFIRNAFAHAPFSPTWSIDADCEAKVFTVPHVIELDTADLNGRPFDWKHYGGPIALLRLCQFVRVSILGDNRPPRTTIPMPKQSIVQYGDLILTRVSELPSGAEVTDTIESGDALDLGGGYTIRAAPERPREPDGHSE